jgi:hypothetical protein
VDVKSSNSEFKIMSALSGAILAREKIMVDITLLITRFCIMNLYSITVHTLCASEGKDRADFQFGEG